MARVIQSPGVQITEKDFSQNAVTSNETTILVAGFAPIGPSLEPITITSLSEYEQTFGLPSNGAERYLYHSVKALLRSPATINVVRLPYGSGTGSGYGSNYSALVYPVSGWNPNTNAGTSILTNVGNDGVFVLGKPSLVSLTDEQYENIILGNVFTWSNDTEARTTFDNVTQFGRAGLIILNKSKTTTNSRLEGTYVGLIDNTTVNPTIDYRGINNVFTVTTSGSKLPSEYSIVPTTRLNFALSAEFDGVVGSISQALESTSPFDIGEDKYSDVINLGVFRLGRSTYSPDVDVLNYSVKERYQGSILYYRNQDTSGSGGAPKSFFIENVVNNNSNDVRVLVNPYISGKFDDDTIVGLDTIPNKKIRIASQGDIVASQTLGNPSFIGMNTTTLEGFFSRVGDGGGLYPIGVYTDESSSTKLIGNVPGKLSLLFDKIQNYEVYPLTLTVEAGLGTIYAAAQDNGGVFDEERYLDILGLSATNGNVSGNAATVRTNYSAVFSQFATFASEIRKDHMFVADPLINIFVQSNKIKTLDLSWANFTSQIYWPLRNIFNQYNTSYVTTYANCALVSDDVSDRKVWVPFSGFAASNMATSDANTQPWSAPAGFNRGSVIGAVDIAIYPNQKQRDQLYKINLNPVAHFPADGFVIYGQKTLQKQPSTFDRINVRRLFLSLEDATRRTVKQYVFEPNTLFTRTQVLNTLGPIFENAKNTQGLYDYLLICDERNNTPTVIDANELVVDVYIKPVRTAEFILVNFFATRTSQNFNEIVS